MACKSKLDLVFLCDCTGSMGSYIASAQLSITDIINQITSSGKVDIRFAVIGYEDHCDPKLLHEYDFTADIDTAKAYVSKLYAGGGGDTPEAVEDAFLAAYNLKYREDATKIVITVSDAPPHGLGAFNGDMSPEGCPLGVDAMQVARQMVEKDIIVYTVGVEPTLTNSVFARAFFKTISTITGGRYVPLSDAASLPKVIIYGAEEEIQLAKYTQQIEEEDRLMRLELAEQKENNKDFVEKSEDEILQVVTDRLAKKGVQLETMMITDGSSGEAKAEAASDPAEDELVSLMSDLSTMGEIRALLKDRAPANARSSLPSFAAPSCFSFGRSMALDTEAPLFDASAMPSAPAPFPSGPALGSFGSHAPPAPFAAKKASFGSSAAASAPVSASSNFSYAQELSSVNVSQVRRVVTKTKNKSSNRS